jgi:hypothetical protein
LFLSQPPPLDWLKLRLIPAVGLKNLVILVVIYDDYTMVYTIPVRPVLVGGEPGLFNLSRQKFRFAIKTGPRTDIANADKNARGGD